MSILDDLKECLVLVVFSIPGKIGNKLRLAYLRPRVRYLGKNISIEPFCQFRGLKNLIIGDEFGCATHCVFSAEDNGLLELGRNVSVNRNSVIDASSGGRISIKENTLIAQNVVIRAADHNFSSLDVPIFEQGHTPGKIEIGSDCWIGANVVITKDTIIGTATVVGAGSVVTSNIPAYSVAVGVPCRVIKNRKER